MRLNGDVACELIFTSHQLATQELADRRFGDLRYKYVTARTLEVRKPRAATEHVEIIGLNSCAQLDEGANDLTPALVGQSRHGDFRNRRV